MTTAVTERANPAPLGEAPGGNLTLGEHDQRWQAVQKVVTSPTFAKSVRLTQFLLYVTERSLQGRLNELTEQQIGIHVFGRPNNYNPGDDTIVRGTARQLRQRLAFYYLNEGQSDPIRVSVPTGAYVPAFETNKSTPVNPEEQVSSPVASPVPSAAAGRRTSPARSAWTAMLVASLVLLTLGVVHGRKWFDVPSDSSRLWKQLFSSDRPTLIVTGDGGLNIFENLARRQVDVNEYASRAYLSDSEAKTPPGYLWDPLALREYSPISDVRLMSRLVVLPEARESHTTITFARDLKADDLRQDNLILIGSPMFDPWVQMFDRDANFSIRYDGETNVIRVMNKAPRHGEQQIYSWRPDDPERVGYAIVSLTDNLMKTGRVLLLQGTTAVGTATATDFIFSPDLENVVRQAQAPDGKLRNFEVLLETRFTGGASSHARVLATRTY